MEKAVSKYRWMVPNADSIIAGLARTGFRKWYERQLVISHGWMAACFIGIIAVASGLELLSDYEGFAELFSNAVVIASASWITWVAWKQYSTRMVLAEGIGEQAHCLNCGHYGFKVDGRVHAHGKMTACCPKCGHRWPVSHAHD
jgi:ABC-type nickel/cobalt efflux system permease component RcnA